MATLNTFEGLLPAQQFDQTEQPVMVGPPATPTPIPEIIAALRTVTQLDGLTEEEYTWIATHGHERVGPDRAILFRDNDPATNMNFILRGEVQVRRRHAGNVALFIGRAGSMTGKLPFSRMKNYGGEGFSVGPVWSIDVPETLFPEMLQAIPSMGQRCVSILLDRVREVTRIEQQSEKLTALGKLAGKPQPTSSTTLPLPPSALPPASSASSASTANRSTASAISVSRSRRSQAIVPGCRTPARACRPTPAAHRGRRAPSLSPTARTPSSAGSNDHNVPQPWTIAPALSETHLPIDLLDELASITRPEVLPVAIATVASSLRVERMAETVVDSTVRIFDLISAIKDYSYMDQAPIQDVDLAQSLENTLVDVQLAAQERHC